jgi:hypothetical protein
MSSELPIVCKPTPWFLFRGLVVFLMFGVFAVLFFKDGSIGYRKANETYFIHKSFEGAIKEFQRINAGEGVSAEQWKTHALSRQVEFPVEASLLPSDLKQPMPWPEILHDYEKVKPMNLNKLWAEYSGLHELPSKPAEHHFSEWKIREQWGAFAVCATLSAIAAFFVLRTRSRSISADERGITSQTGKAVPYSDLRTLDLRKWETKGLAFLDYSGPEGSGRIRLDGLTYGGFKKEEGEPAECLMRVIRARFSGELIEYASPTVKDEAHPGDDSTVDSSDK